MARAMKGKTRLAERIRYRRNELGLTRNQLLQRITDLHETVSSSTLREMEKSGYRLPQRRSNKGLLPIEIVAKALGVPLGYLLGGFNEEHLRTSCFYAQIKSGIIELQDQQQADSAASEEPFQEFLAGLPRDEMRLRKLPLHTYRNERAFAVIFRFESIYCGREMLLGNEPPLIFWDDEDLELWSSNMELSSKDRKVFAAEFDSYKHYFRQLARQNKKTYHVVLNHHRLVNWITRKRPANARRLLENLLEFNELPSFTLLLLKPKDSMGHLLRGPHSHEFNESEVISKHTTIPDSLEDTIAVQILQTPPDISRVEYFVAPLYPFKIFLQREKSKIDEATALAIDQMELLPYKKSSDTNSRNAACAFLLKRLLQEHCG